MKHSVSRDLHSYWDALRAGRAGPERRDIDPVVIRHLLAYTFILDMSGGDRPGARRVSFRLSGTRLDAMFQSDLKGRDFGSLWTGRDARAAEAMLDVALDDRAPAVASVRASPSGYVPIDLELLLLPLKSDGRTQARILGSLASSAVPGWMGLRPVETLELASFRAMAEKDARRSPAPFDIAPARPFKVYEGGRSVGRAAEIRG